MGNQAVGLQRQIQQSEAFDEDRATTQKAAEYTGQMTRDPNFQPDPQSSDYDPIADIRAKAEWQRLDDNSRKSKIDKYKQAFTEKRQLANDLFWQIRLAKQQGQNVNPELSSKIISSLRTLNNRFIPNGVYASEPGIDGTVQMISQTSGEIADTIDPKNISMDQLEQFLLSNMQDNPQQFISTMMAEEKSVQDFNAEAFAKPYIMGKPGGGPNDIIKRVVARDKISGELKTHYIDANGEISEDDARAYSVPLGRWGDDRELLAAQRQASMNKAQFEAGHPEGVPKPMTDYERSREARETDKYSREQGQTEQTNRDKAMQRYENLFVDPLRGGISKNAPKFDEWYENVWKVQKDNGPSPTESRYISWTCFLKAGS
jgi:hypothetical protein